MVTLTKPIRANWYNQPFMPAIKYKTLMEKIQVREASVAIIGLGYVGLPLAVAFAEAGFPVTGIDIDPKKSSRSY